MCDADTASHVFHGPPVVGQWLDRDGGGVYASRSPIRSGVGGDGYFGARYLRGLQTDFVAILVAAGCNVREVSEWAGHNNVAFTLTRYGGLFEDGSDEAVDLLDALLGRVDPPGASVSPLRRRES